MIQISSSLVSVLLLKIVSPSQYLVDCWSSFGDRSKDCLFFLVALKITGVSSCSETWSNKHLGLRPLDLSLPILQWASRYYQSFNLRLSCFILSFCRRRNEQIPQWKLEESVWGAPGADGGGSAWFPQAACWPCLRYAERRRCTVYLGCDRYLCNVIYLFWLN